MSPLRTEFEPRADIDQRDPSAVTSLEHFAQRISTEIRAAEDRVKTLQSEAAIDFVGEKRRLQEFIAAANRINTVLLQRLQAMTNTPTFQDIRQLVSLEFTAVDSELFHGRTVTLTVPNSDKRPTAMELSFRVGHDDLLRNVVIDYRLEINPIFIKFDGHDQLVTPIDNCCEETVVKWVDEKLVGFTRTYFEVYFHHEYQKKQLVVDPVMNVQFPKSFAVGKKQLNGKTYYLYTEESQRAFEENPSKYVGGVGVSP